MATRPGPRRYADTAMASVGAETCRRAVRPRHHCLETYGHAPHQARRRPEGPRLATTAALLLTVTTAQPPWVCVSPVVHHEVFLDTLSFAHLPAFEQHRISGFLAVLAQPWLASGEWPVWGHVQHAYDIRGDDADRVLQSLPRVGVAGPFGSGYGYTTGMRPPIDEGDRVRVTVAGGLVLPELRAAVGEPFLLVLHHMI